MKSLAEITFEEARGEIGNRRKWWKLWAAAKVKACEAIVSVFHSEDCPFFSAPVAEIKEVGDAHYCNQDCRCPACRFRIEFGWGTEEAYEQWKREKI